MIMTVIADEPGAPGTPDVTDWDRDYVDLKWTPPSKDGGSPITGYVIEKREKGNPKWTKAAELHSPDCKGRADNLEEGVEYEFRVRAVNEAGPGEPSQPSKSVITKPRKCKIFITQFSFRLEYFKIMNPEEYYLHMLSVLSVCFVLSIEPQPKKCNIWF